MEKFSGGGGFFASLFGSLAKEDYDLDAWLGLYTNKNEYIGVVYFNNLKYYDDRRNCVIQHFGDNLTGQGKGDNEDSSGPCIAGDTYR